MEQDNNINPSGQDGINCGAQIGASAGDGPAKNPAVEYDEGVLHEYRRKTAAKKLSTHAKLASAILALCFFGGFGLSIYLAGYFPPQRVFGTYVTGFGAAILLTVTFTMLKKSLGKGNFKRLTPKAKRLTVAAIVWDALLAAAAVTCGMFGHIFGGMIFVGAGVVSIVIFTIKLK